MGSNIPHTITYLKRWSCQDKQLPVVGKIKHIHIYDFDNTLFASPLPNKQIWISHTCGQIQGQEFLHNGGWWHNPNILAATGGGMDVEETKAWEGYWNERIVELVRMSMEDAETLTVLLTGRKEDAFAALISRLIAAKRLEFDIVSLKPNASPIGETFTSTLEFKEKILRDIVCTYVEAKDIRIYEDRPKHAKAFRDYFAQFNRSLMSAMDAPRGSITATVVEVSEQELSMDPVSEVAEVQKMINHHNQSILDGTAPPRAIPYQIKRSVSFTAYMVAAPDVERLKTLVKNGTDAGMRFLANCILITPRPAPRSILDKVGGIGATVRWKVVGLAVHDQRVWAARVQPVPTNTRIFTDKQTPYVVLATRRQGKASDASNIRNWQPVSEDQAFQFETTVREKDLLRIEEETGSENVNESTLPNTRNTHKRPRDEEFPPLGPRNSGPRLQHRHSGQQGLRGNKSGGGTGPAASRGGGTHSRGGQRGGGPLGGFRGRRGNIRGGGRGGARGAYRSLDDSAGQSYGSGGMQY